jgi:DNA-binding PadR family transcriptional regulator
MTAIAPTARTPDKALLTAWLLLMMRDQADRHGWAIVSTLRGHGVAVESGRAYRILRELDAAGAVSSRWTTSVHGPRRRSYRLTLDGRQRLDELAADISATWELLDAFLRAHELPPDQAHTPADDPDSESNDPPPPGEGAPPDTPAHPQLTRELLAAWLLLLIARQASYGYSLRRALRDSDIHPDPGTLYRVLHHFEQNGWLESRWMPASAGPRRRLYRITARGRRNLDGVARVIAATRDTHATFLRVYDEQPATNVS